MKESPQQPTHEALKIIDLNNDVIYFKQEFEPTEEAPNRSTFEFGLDDGTKIFVLCDPVRQNNNLTSYSGILTGGNSLYSLETTRVEVEFSIKMEYDGEVGVESLILKPYPIQ